MTVVVVHCVVKILNAALITVVDKVHNTGLSIGRIFGYVKIEIFPNEAFKN